MRRRGDHAARAGHLRADLTVEHAGLLMWTLTSPQLYELLVIRRGGPIKRYAAFITASLTAALLAPA